MYNEEQKTRFIKSYTQSLSTAKAAVRVFNFVEPYEVSWGADLCTRSAEELRPVVNAVVGRRDASKWTSLGVLRQYVRWCVAHDIPGATDGILKINSAGLEKVRLQMVSGPVHLQRYLDSFLDPIEDETIDLVYRCFYWLAFLGFDEDEALSIRSGDVDFENMRVTYGGRSCVIYPQALPVLRKCAQLHSFRYNHPRYTVMRDRVPGDLLLRGVKSDANISTIRSAISRRNEKAVKDRRADMRLSFTRIRTSGVFYRMYENELAGFPVDFAAVTSDFMEGKTYVNRTRSARETATTIEREFTEDYNRWKIVFQK